MTYSEPYNDLVGSLTTLNIGEPEFGFGKKGSYGFAKKPTLPTLYPSFQFGTF